VSQVPYQPDIAAALDVARWDAYRAGNYYQSEPTPEARAMSEDEYVRWCESTEGTQASLEVSEEWRAAQIDPVDPDSLLASQPFSGTHSIIDMTEVGSEPCEHTVAPAPAEVLDELFGTRTPTTAQVEDALDILDLYGRWCGTYVVGHQEGRPHTIYFVGHSGD
jgi:hypothetical protein